MTEFGDLKIIIYTVPPTDWILNDIRGDLKISDIKRMCSRNSYWDIRFRCDRVSLTSLGVAANALQMLLLLQLPGTSPDPYVGVQGASHNFTPVDKHTTDVVVTLS